MIRFAVATKPPTIVGPAVRYVSYGLGFWATLLAVAQMVSFEDFVEALRQYRLGGEGMTVAIAIGIVTLEIFTVPFLFRLALSRAARWVSALFVLLLPLAWTVLTVHALLIHATVGNAGYLGGFLPIHVGVAVALLDVVWVLVVALSFSAIGGTKAFKLKS